MSIHQIALLLQILGVALLSVFAGILLQKDMVGRWAEKIESVLISFVHLLRKLTPPILIEAGKPGPSSKLISELSEHILVVSITICLLVGWLNDISILFWCGVFLAFLYRVVKVSLVRLPAEILQRLEASRRKRLTIFLGTLLILLLSIITSPLVVFDILIELISLCCRLWDVTTKIMIQRETPKKAAMVIGCLMLLVGLIIEFFVAG